MKTKVGKTIDFLFQSDNREEWINAIPAWYPEIMSLKGFRR